MDVMELKKSCTSVEEKKITGAIMLQESTVVSISTLISIIQCKFHSKL